MGVDFFPCHYCSETICDCGHYESCEHCGRHWCGPKCAKKEGLNSRTGRCSYCRKKKAETYELLEYLLTKYNLTRKEVEKEYLEKSVDTNHKT